MFLPILALSFIYFSIGACSSNGESESEHPQTTFTIAEAFDSIRFSNPVEMALFPNSSDFIVLEQAGKIYRVKNQFIATEKVLLADITSLVLSGGELGLLGIAFDPQFTTNNFVFVNYTASSPRRTVIARFTYNPNLQTLDLSSKLVVLEYNQPYSNHNGGKIAFGPDGFLYISAGDGGSGGDPQGNGQNKKSLLGKLLRLDVSQTSLNEPYKIPASNPFVQDTTARAEIYAYGLRNPWKFSFDSESNRLWLADVGQNSFEEINLIESGKNYGWNFREGFHEYNNSGEAAAKFAEPIHEYGRSQGGSVTGGYVYHGKMLGTLRGNYIYGDYLSGNIWALSYTNGKAKNQKLLNTGGKTIATFGVDSLGEHYFASLNGHVYKIIEGN
jgi:glucose/arabinose dehydrogenase